MKTLLLLVRGLTVLLVTILLSSPAWSQTAAYEQTIDLQPGWNAVFIQVEPEDNRIDTVFAGVPVASVWRWIPRGRGARFVRDPAEGLENVEGWFAWFPEPRPEAFLSNLFRINGDTAYLVRVEGSQSHQIRVSGKPTVRRLAWQSDAYSLTGLPVAETDPPTFAEFFSGSAGHRDQPIYRLSSNGQWQEVNAASTPVRSGEAYWIYTQGNSSYQGRLGLILEQGESMEFAAALEEIRVVLRNRSELDGTFLIRRLGGATMPLAFLNEDPETGQRGWPSLPEQVVFDAPARSELFLTLGVVRRDFTASRMEQILEITDEMGERILLHVGGNTIQPLILPDGATQAGRGNLNLAARETGASMAGLWLGEVEVSAVSESQRAGVIPEPAPQSFSQRFMIHVDLSGQSRLVKDVIQMWEEGTLAPSAQDPSFNEVVEGGRYVLLTDPGLINLYSGAINRSGTSVGQRYSTIAYDFEGDTLIFDGAFELGGQISTTLVIDPDLPANPFLHRFHPDHDNKDAQFLNFELESYQIVREMRLTFADTDPRGNNPPGWGETLVGGFFEESITGLHKNTIFTSGEFRLRRISAVPVLNQ